MRVSLSSDWKEHNYNVRVAFKSMKMFEGGGNRLLFDSINKLENAKLLDNLPAVIF